MRQQRDYLQIQIVFAFTEEQEGTTNTLKQLNNIILNNMLITDIINTKDCINIDTLQEGDEITIIAIKRRGLGNKDKYIFYTEETNQKIAYISNPFLELLRKQYGIPKTKFKLLIGPYRTTRTQNKSRNIIIPDIETLTGQIKEETKLIEPIITEQEPHPEPQAPEPQTPETEAPETQQPIIKLKKPKKTKKHK
jgi:hypothetical protein